jgi:outer membrane protein TolC
MQQELPLIVQKGVPSGILQQRPDISAALSRLSAAYEQTEAARKAFLPSFNIGAYLGLQGFRMPAFFNAESITAGLAGNIMAPLLQRRQIRGQYAVSEAEHELAWLDYKKRVRFAVMEVHNSLKGIEALGAQFSVKQKELDALRTAVRTANDLYTNGYANYLEVITAQQSLLDADLQLVQLRLQQMQYIIRLYRSTGGGWK